MKNFIPLFILLTAALTAQTNYYVRADGNDSNSGLSETVPFKTLKTALEKASSGSVITVTGTLDIKSEEEPYDITVFAVLNRGKITITQGERIKKGVKKG
jgi:TusA-related sulfurtransferase